MHDLVDCVRRGRRLRPASSAASICVSQSSSASFGRALSAGNEPTIPDLHCSITSCGLPAMNIGAPMTGRRRLFRIGGKAMRISPNG